jgi:hypothetical protein
MNLSEQNILQSLMEPHQRYAIYGAGTCCVQMISRFRTMGLHPPAVILDDNPRVDTLQGIPVRAPTEQAIKGLEAVVLGSDTHQHGIRKRIAEVFDWNIPVLEILHDNLVAGEGDPGDCSTASQNTEILYQLNRLDPAPGAKLKIYFLLNSIGHLSSCESVIHACIKEADVETKIITCPRKEYRNGADDFSSLAQLGCDIVPIDEYDACSDLPHVLIVMIPYQSQWFPSWMKMPNFFKERGVRCVYISYGIEYDTSTESGHLRKTHFKMAIHQHAWRIYTCSPLVLRDYGRYCPAGKEHVRFLGHPKIDRIYNKDDYPLSKQLQNKIGERKIITWQIHHYDCTRFEGVKKPRPGFHNIPFKETCRILRYLQKEQDTFFALVTIHPYFHHRAVSEGVASRAEVDRFLKQLNDSDNSAWCEHLDYRYALAAADAFISEHSSLLVEMTLMNKPVLYLEDIPVTHNDFGSGIVSSHYKGKGVEDVATFVDMLNRNCDDNALHRRKALEKYLPLRDGKSGERILNDIVESISDELAGPLA